MSDMTTRLPEYLSAAVSPFGTFTTISCRRYTRAVVYLPADRERDGREGFCAGWATTLERAEEIANTIRAKGEVNVFVVPVSKQRPWIRRRRSEPEE